MLNSDFRTGEPSRNLVFDSPVAEDFKRSMGTWVNVGILKAKILSAGAPVVQDVVSAGLDRAYVRAILFLTSYACRELAALPVAPRGLLTPSSCWSPLPLTWAKDPVKDHSINERF